jgi:hypothetical protein
MALFTAESARIMGIKSAQAKKERKLNPPPKPSEPLSTEKATAPTVKLDHTRKIERLESQMEAIDLLLEKASDAKDWRDLTNAKLRLFEQWTCLAGISRPGSTRPAPASAQRRQPPAGPIGVQPGQPASEPKEPNG